MKKIILTNGTIQHEFTRNAYGNPLIVSTKPVEVGEVYYEAYSEGKTRDERRRVATEEDVKSGLRICWRSEIVSKEDGNRLFLQLKAEGWVKL